ncbi:uncharacterized protein LOC123307124 [Coccinella septempunctata]|uniref:uncharacterized protein LOC123307124 n=1 Tax=Coccinella septempunctata TaxID=41139 RepID=UPI001D07F848|nr:uncharacterized protein LOC123307124 [Coccinella septempunctata]
MKFLVFSAVLILCSVGVLGDNSIQPVAVETSNSSSRAKRNNSSISIGEASNQKTTPANIKKVICPNKIERIPFLSLPCDFDSECSIFGSKMVCCFNRCIQGVVPLKKEDNPKVPKEF